MSTDGWVFVGIVGVIALGGVVDIAARMRYAKRRRRVERAAAEASLDDPGFARNVVLEAAESLFELTRAAWRAQDETAIAQLVTPHLLARWLRQLGGGRWHDRDELTLDSVEYVGIVNRPGEQDDRVTVYVSLLGPYPFDDRDDFAEFWTLARCEGRWVVAAIETELEGVHVLEAPIVGTPDADHEAVHDAAVFEVADGERLPADIATIEVADLDYADDARTAVRDLSLVDGRWAPAVLEATVRRILAALVRAVDGPDDELRALATPAAAAALRGRSRAGTHRMVRGPRASRVRVMAWDAAAVPPTVGLELTLHALSLIVHDRTGEYVGGSTRKRKLRWTLALDGSDERPWRLVAVKQLF